MAYQSNSGFNTLTDMMKAMKSVLIVVLIFGNHILNAQVVITPNEYPDALRNPLKGLRWGFKNLDWSSGFPNTAHPYVSCGKWYIGWDLIENDESDDVLKIRNYCDALWTNLPSGNNKIIPRIYLDFGGTDTHWPADMTTGDWTSEEFKSRLERLIGRLGEVWDNDPRVAYVEMGIYGLWGELHTPYPDASIQTILGDAFTNAFVNKKIMTHHQETYDLTLFDTYYSNQKFGVYWDSFAHLTEGFFADDIDGLGDFWKAQVIGGETAYNWGGVEAYIGACPTATMTTVDYYNHVNNYIRRCHANHVGWVAEYDVNNTSTHTGADLMQKALGYRFLLNSVTCPDKIIQGENFEVLFTVTNTGSSPFYYKWPVELSLLSTNDYSIVWKDLFQNVDIRTWMPGDNWQYNTSDPSIAGTGFATPSLAKNERGVFNIPQYIPDGKYILALAILDPSGMLPSIKFATENYFNGGHHPIAYVGLNVSVTSPELSDVTFDDLQLDRSMHYIYPTPSNIFVTSPRGNDIWNLGKQKIITWESFGKLGNVDIDLSVNGGFSWIRLIENTANDGSEQITVPDNSATTCRIRIQENSGSVNDISNANFVIKRSSDIDVNNNNDITNTITIQNFNNSAFRIKYNIVETSHIEVIVFNSLGKKVAVLVNENKSPGVYDLQFNTENLTNGIYYCYMKYEKKYITKKIVVVR